MKFNGRMVLKMGKEKSYRQMEFSMMEIGFLMFALVKGEGYLFLVRFMKVNIDLIKCLEKAS